VKYFVPILLLLAAQYTCGQSQVVIGNQNPSVTGISVPPATLPVGLTAQLTAQYQLSDGTNTSPATSQCVWASSNTAVATVSNGSPSAGPSGLVSAVSAGSSNISCTPPGLTCNGVTPCSGTGVVTVVAAPAITNPNAATCGPPPCALITGTNGVAYSFPFMANPACPASGWSVSTGSLPGWASLNSTTGVLSGTAATGTTNFTIECTPSIGSPATLAVTLTINSSGPTCGPPAYNCTPNLTVSGGAFTPTYPFTGQGSPSSSGVDNTYVAVPEPGNSQGLYQNPITRITNAHTGCGANNEPSEPCTRDNVVYAPDAGGSADVDHWATDSSWFSVSDNDNATYFFTWNASTMQATFQYTNFQNGAGCCVLGMPQTLQDVDFSHVTNNLVYGWANTTNTGGGVVLNKWALTTYPTLPTPVAVYNFTTSPNCLPSTQITETDPVNINTSDTTFTDGFSNSTTENTGRYVAQYKVGSGCSAINWTPVNGHPTVTGDWGSTGSVTCPDCVIAPTITTCMVSGGTATAGMSSSAGIYVNDSITVTGNSACNGTYTVTALTATSVSWTLAGSTSATGGTLTDNTVSPGTFSVHNVKASRDGSWAAVTRQTGCDSGSVCFNNSDPFFWHVGTTYVYVHCPASLTGCGPYISGHWTNGYTAFINNPQRGSWSQWAYGATPGNTTSTAFPSSWPSTYTQTFDNHLGYQHDNTTDTLPFNVASSSETVVPDYSKCCVDELLLVWPPSSSSSGQVKREGHLYGWPTVCFNPQVLNQSESQDGRFVSFSSPMGANLGCTNGASSGCSTVTSGSASCTSAYNAGRGDVFVMELQ
jgi:hypothetical protein